MQSGGRPTDGRGEHARSPRTGGLSESSSTETAGETGGLGAVGETGEAGKSRGGLSRYTAVKRAFADALALTGRDRAAFVRRLAETDTALAEQVAAMLDADSGPSALDASPGLSGVDESLEPQPIAIGPFKVIGVLGRGATSTVFRAVQRGPEREVAVKLLASGVLSSRRRFEAEAAVLAHLSHHAIAQVYTSDTDPTSGRPYIAMELVRGAEIITEFAREHDLDDRSRVRLFIDAIQHAHGRGVIHRDIKPANILVDDQGRVKVVDFGVARRPAFGPEISSLAAGVVGTLTYMSPEQLRGDVTVTSDVYSLGAVLYQLACGRPPVVLDDDDVVDSIQRIGRGMAVPPQRLNKSCRGDLGLVISKALSVDPAARYQSAAQLADDLRRWLANEPILARREPTWRQITRIAARRRGLTAAALVALAGLIGVTGWAWHLREQAEYTSRSMLGAAIAALKTMESRSGTGEAQQALIRTHMPVAEDLAQRNPRDPEVQLLLASLLAAEATRFTYQDQWERAEPLRRRVVDILGPLVQSFPDKPAYSKAYYVALITLGDVERRKVNLPAAFDLYARAEAIQARLLQANPDQPAVLDDLGWSVLRRAEQAFVLGRLDEAARGVSAMLTIAERGAQLRPFSPHPPWMASHAHRLRFELLLAGLHGPPSADSLDAAAGEAVEAVRRARLLAPDDTRYICAEAEVPVRFARRMLSVDGNLAAAATVLARCERQIEELRRLGHNGLSLTSLETSRNELSRTVDMVLSNPAWLPVLREMRRAIALHNRQRVAGPGPALDDDLLQTRSDAPH